MISRESISMWGLHSAIGQNSGLMIKKKSRQQGNNYHYHFAITILGGNTRVVFITLFINGYYGDVRDDGKFNLT